MQNKYRLILSVFYALFFLAYCSLSFAETFSRFTVENRLVIDLPTGWEIHDRTERKSRSDQAKKLLKSDQDFHTAALSAASYPMPSKLRVRISFIRLGSSITQEELNEWVLDDSKDDVIEAFREAFDSEMLLMWRKFAKVGIQEVGKRKVSIEKIDGLTAIVLRYQRTSGTRDASIVKVSQYHLMLGSEKALITFSHASDEPQLIKTLERIKTSIQFKQKTR